MRSVQIRLNSTHAECIKSAVHILLSVDVPVLPYYRLLYVATHFLCHLYLEKLLSKHILLVIEQALSIYKHYDDTMMTMCQFCSHVPMSYCAVAALCFSI